MLQNNKISNEIGEGLFRVVTEQNKETFAIINNIEDFQLINFLLNQVWFSANQITFNNLPKQRVTNLFFLLIFPIGKNITI
jgi:hypothetical protein